jgi:DNA-binding transcriptional ArsR family regulator
MHGNMSSDPDIAAVAAALADRSRILMLTELAEGKTMPAGELARHARVSAQTASAHLVRLLDAGLVNVDVLGRHRYYRVANPDVARLIEAMSLVAPRRAALTPLQSEAAATLRFARTCYSHLAGVLGVSATEAMVSRGYLEDCDAGWIVTERGTQWFQRLQINIDDLRRRRRPLTRPCLDWSERRHHLAGALGDAITTRCFEMRWIARVRQSRAVRLTDRGREAFQRELGVNL